MALSTYIELQAAIRSEVHKTTAGLPDTVIVDAITRAESKVNRRCRLRSMETLQESTLNPGTRFLALPAGYLELLSMQAKVSTASDSTYERVPYVEPAQIHRYYDDTQTLRFTLRDGYEFNREVSAAHTIRQHYLKRFDIASDSTNWLLTNFPDVYLYGALAECEMHVVNDKRIPLWKAYFDEGIAEVNELDERGRDDAELDTSEIGYMAGTHRFNILTGY